MIDLRWDEDDFRNEQDSSGSTADLVSHSGKLQQGYKHGSLTDGLVAYYPMEKGEGEVLHDGALDNLGQINGATWNGSGKTGSYSLNFNGTDNDVALSKPFNLTRGYTLSAWIYFGDLSDRNRTIHIDDSNQFIAIGTDNGGDWEIIHYHGSGSTKLLGTEQPSVNTWYHVVLRWDTSTLTAFINGEENSSASESSIGGRGNSKNIIGSYETGGYHQGEVDDIRIYDRALSESEIQSLANNVSTSGTQVTEKQVPGQDQGGISRYKLNGDPNDAWGTNDGTENGVSYQTGVYGQAAKFNGTSDYISISPSWDFSSSTSFTISAWYNATQDRDQTIVGQRSSGYNFWYIFNNSGNIRMSVKGDSNSSHAISGSFSVNTWQHVTGVYDGSGKVTLYLNGIHVSEDSANISGDIDGSKTNLNIGSYGNGNDTWDGKIDDVRIYKTALTPRQVEKLYHKGAYRIPRESTLQ